ncbi:serine/threonine-protein phosphatase [Synechocystis salina LEGE 06155]|nr:serine/threonine-protein phosphatase [Synechocystis salina LEGE 06155]
MPTVHCSNHDCQAPNDLGDRLCKTCQTPLLKRYLWAVGDWIKAYRPGELLLDRYLLVRPQVLLDTTPALGVEGPDEIPAYILPYQKLLPFRLNVPEVYDYFPSCEAEKDLSVWLLDYGPVPLDEAGEPLHERLLPSLGEMWEQASPLQQLTWLWQMIRIWQPLQRQAVVSSLLEFDWLRVQGPQIFLQQLKLDDHQFYETKYLAGVWEPLLTNAHPAIADFCQTLWQKLKQGKIPHADYLLRVLDTGIQSLAEQYDFSYTVFALTDAGPTRDHNEDACFPVSETPIEGQQLANTMTLICDGVGGQEGGEIASQWVIDHLPIRIISKIQKQMNEPDQIRRFIQHLKEDVEEVNEQLNRRNDREERVEKERMGTTLVMALADFQQFFLANVGDSRCYWLTKDSCKQVTVDDDVASREVRLGLMLYRHAVELPRSGALTQAVGLGPAGQLHPIIQRLIVPTDCLFLLCSDGFCDNNRVEQYWQDDFLPVLQGDRPLAEAVPRLIELANQVNGHDNVSVALMHCQISPSVPTPTQAEAAAAATGEDETTLEEDFAGDTEFGLKAIAYPDFSQKPVPKEPEPEHPIPQQDPKESLTSRPLETQSPLPVEEVPVSPLLDPQPLPGTMAMGRQRGGLADKFQALSKTSQLLIAGGTVVIIAALTVVVLNLGQNNGEQNQPSSSLINLSVGHG